MTLPDKQIHYHLSDLRTGLMLRQAGTPLGNEVLQKADLCAHVLAEASLLVTGGVLGPMLADRMAHATDLLGELDEALLALDHTRDHAVFAQLAVLHRELDEIRRRRDEA